MQGVGDLIIFDGDDTLWRVEHLYDEARRGAAAIAAEVGIDPDHWSLLQKEIDLANVATHGLSRDRFPTSSVLAYERAAAELGIPIDAQVRERIREASAEVFDRVAPLMPAAREVVAELAENHRLALLTQGDAAVQQKRIDDSGLARFFALTVVVPRKDEDAFADVLRRAKADPKRAWSVGNSLPSDINPALRLGMSAIWIDAHVWHHERRESAPVDGRLFVCRSLEEVPTIIAEHTALVG